jgi:hypothetical protein
VTAEKHAGSKDEHTSPQAAVPCVVVDRSVFLGRLSASGAALLPAKCRIQTRATVTALVHKRRGARDGFTGHPSLALCVVGLELIRGSSKQQHCAVVSAPYPVRRWSAEWFGHRQWRRSCGWCLALAVSAATGGSRLKGADPERHTNQRGQQGRDC